MKKNKRETVKVLLGCSKGFNRSKYLAEYLQRKGYKTKYGGVEGWNNNQRWKENPITQNMINWADIIIVVRPRLKEGLQKKFSTKKKKIIVLDVSDSKRLLPKEFSSLKDLDYENFQKEWTRPQLRKAIKPYLPLTK